MTDYKRIDTDKIMDAENHFKNRLSIKREMKFLNSLILVFISVSVAFMGCKKECKIGEENVGGKCVLVQPVKTCRFELGEYEKAKTNATADSTAAIDFKSTASNKFLAMFTTYMNEGQTEEEAWESALNNFSTNPNASAEIREWVQTYIRLRNTFNKSVNKRQETFYAWDGCQKML